MLFSGQIQSLSWELNRTISMQKILLEIWNELFVYSTLHCASYSYWDQHSSGVLPLFSLLHLQPRVLALNNSYFQASGVYPDRLICTPCTFLCSHFGSDTTWAVRHHHQNKAKNTPGNYVAQFSQIALKLRNKSMLKVQYFAFIVTQALQKHLEKNS